MHRLLPWVPDIQQATFVDVQNVSDYFWQDKREFWDLNDFKLSPPWPFFATRYTVPDEIYSDEKGRNPMRRFAHGTEILTVFREMEGVPNYIQLKGRKEANSRDRIKIPGARWYYDIHIFPVLGKQVMPPGVYFLAVDERGLVAKQPGRDVRAFFTAAFHKEYEVQTLPVSYLHVSGLALTFLHSRNVHLLQPEPAPAKRRQPREGTFKSRYYRLRVEALGARRERSSESQPTGISQALHIVRGHFRYYGRAAVNGNPRGEDTGLLFSKYEGAYWIAGHAAGSAEAGLVTKDYEVIPHSPLGTTAGRAERGAEGEGQ